MTNSNTTKTTGGKKAAPERNSAATEKRKTLPVNNIQPNAQKASPEDTARRIIAAADVFPQKGYSALPCIRKTKKPRGSWKEYQTRRMSPTEFKTRALEIGADAIAVISGAVSGNLMALDFDNHNGAACVFDEWKGYVEETETGKALFARLYVECSQSGGYHVMTRLEHMPDGLEKDVAFVEPAEPEDAPQSEGDKAGKNAKREKWACVIEARGEGCYTICAPTPGYTVIQGSPAEYPKITPDEWEILLTAAARCDKRPITGQEEPIRHEKAAYGKGWAKTPGDGYNARENALDEMAEMLLEDGWKYDRDGKLEDGTQCKHYTRPGKDEGTSGSVFVGKEGVPVFKCFTSNAAPFEYMGAYNPFAVYAMLKHGGDFKAAASALHAEGYGEKDAASKKTPGINELAAGFLAEWDAARTVNGGHCLKMYRGAFYEFRRDSGWREISGGDLGGHIAEYLWKRKVDATAKRQSDIKAALSARHLCLLPSDTETPVRVSTGESLDRAAVISVKNGVLRIPDGAKRAADLVFEALTEDIFTPYTLPVCYDPKAKAPTFARYLREVLPDSEDQAAIRRMFGYALTPDRRLQVFFILYGAPATGKSSAILPLAALLGKDLYSTRPYEQLGDKFAAADLAGKLLNWSGEIHFNDLGLSEERIKQITGGEPLTVERKYMPAYTAPATALLVFASNELPQLRDKTGSILRRLRMILFETVIPEEKRDAGLQDKIGRELPGVLNFALEGLIELRSMNTFPESKNGRALNEETRQLNDPFPEALDACTEKAPGAFILAKDLYGALKAHFYNAGNKRYAEMTDAKLAREVIRVLGIEKKVREGGKGRWGYKGVKLKG